MPARAINHAGITFTTWDSGDGTPVLFQHGLGGSHVAVTSVLGERPDYRLISFDARAHGGSTPLGDPADLSFATFAADDRLLNAEMVEHGDGVGGMSMGAGIALTIAVNYPERVRSLILVRPAWLDQPMPENLAMFPAMAELLRTHGVEEGMRRFRQTAWYREAAPYPSASASYDGQFTRPLALERSSVLDVIPADCPPSGSAVWGAIAVPTTVIATDRDPVHPLSYGQHLAAAIPGAVLHTPVSKWVDEPAHNAEIRRIVGTVVRANT
ncbi:MAG: alpha/beta fold hydrolase [Chloroflexota bacterium]